MTTISPIKSGLVLGAVIGLWHLVWSLMVAIRLGATPHRFRLLDALYQARLRH